MNFYEKINSVLLNNKRQVYHDEKIGIYYFYLVDKEYVKFVVCDDSKITVTGQYSYSCYSLELCKNGVYVGKPIYVGTISSYGSSNWEHTCDGKTRTRDVKAFNYFELEKIDSNLTKCFYIAMKELNRFDTEKETVLRVSIKNDQIEMPFEGWLKQPFHMGQSNLGVKVPTPQDLVDYVTKPLLERIEVLEKRLAELIDITDGVIEANKELIGVLDKNKREKQSEF